MCCVSGPHGHAPAEPLAKRKVVKMNLVQQNAIAEKFFIKCQELLKSKGSDYTPEDIAFKDVMEIARDLQVSPRKVLWVYARKHFTAIRRWIRDGDVNSEPIETRLIDMANYCALLYVMSRDQSYGQVQS